MVFTYRYVGVGKCLLLVDMDMDIWYLSHLCLWELMKADKQRVRSKKLDGTEGATPKPYSEKPTQAEPLPEACAVLSGEFS